MPNYQLTSQKGLLSVVMRLLVPRNFSDFISAHKNFSSVMYDLFRAPESKNNNSREEREGGLEMEEKSVLVLKRKQWKGFIFGTMANFLPSSDPP